MHTRPWTCAGERPDDEPYGPDDRDAETPEPCRGCGSIHCASECAAYRAWQAVAWLEHAEAVRDLDAAR